MQILSLSSDVAYGANAYYVTDGSVGVLIDPAVSADGLRAQLGAACPFPSHVLLTHGHYDHILYLSDYAAAGCTVYVGAGDEALLLDAFKNVSTLFGRRFCYEGPYRVLTAGEVLPLLGGMEVISTPGHTPGSVCYRLGEALLCGDLLFSGGGYGRTDFPGGDSRALRSSIRQVLSLSELLVYPGHGPAFRLSSVAEALSRFL